MALEILLFSVVKNAKIMPNADTGNGFQLITALHQSTVTYSVVVLELMLKSNRYVATHGYMLDVII